MTFEDLNEEEALDLFDLAENLMHGVCPKMNHPYLLLWAKECGLTENQLLCSVHNFVRMAFYSVARYYRLKD